MTTQRVPSETTPGVEYRVDVRGRRYSATRAPYRKPKTALQRFCEKFAVAECGCWLTGAKDNDSYASFSVSTRLTGRRGHRWFYEQLFGALAADVHLDHLCRTPSCVNPAHLEPVTPAENIRRGVMGTRATAFQRSKTHCRNGHPYDIFNTYVTTDGRRDCRECRRAAGRRHDAIRRSRR